MASQNHAPGASAAIPFWQGNLADLKRSFKIGRALFSSDFKSTYREAFLGVLWAILPTVFVIFSYMIAESANIVSTNSTGVSTFIFLIVGLLSWQSFSEALNAPIFTLTKNKRFFLKINLPIETFLISKMYDVVFFMVLRHMILLMILFGTGVLPLSLGGAAAAVISFLYIALLVFFGFSLGIAIAPLGMLIQDFTKILNYTVGFLLFCTPVLYKRVETGVLGKINAWNPLSMPIEQIRDSLLFPSEFHLANFAPFVGITLVILGLGYIFLKISKPQIYEKAGI